MNPFKTLNNSWQGLNLSPGERALVKLVEGWLFTALATGVAIAYQLLATGSHDYHQIALVAGGAAGLTILNSFKKYLSSQSDLPLPEASLAKQATDVAISEVQKVSPQAQAAVDVTQIPQVSFQSQPFPQAQGISYQPQAWTAPGLQAMPQPPRG